MDSGFQLGFTNHSAGNGVICVMVGQKPKDDIVTSDFPAVSCWLGGADRDA